MGDFLLDFRDPGQRDAEEGEALRFFPDLEIDRIVNDRFKLVLTRNGRPELWAPYTAPDGTVVAIAGRILLDSSDWEVAKRVSGEGGLAPKAIYKAFQENGYAGVQRMNGAFAIHIYEPGTQRYSLVVDSAGCYASGPLSTSAWEEASQTRLF